MDNLLAYRKLLRIKPSNKRPNSSYLESRVKKIIFTLKKLNLERYSDTRLYLKEKVEGGGKKQQSKILVLMV